MIADNKVVSMHFTLKNQNDEILETTEGDAAFDYLHGAMEILPPLENELTGKNVGDKLSVAIPAADAYGTRDEEMVETLPKSDFAEMGAPIEVGMEIEMQLDDDIFPVLITKIEGEEVTIDMNHPLAGMDLTFDVEIVGVRDATAEELEHGHAHADGGCDH